MSVSEKQLNANRQNAHKSTGPRTPEGKAKVSQNAVKHGLYARRQVITCPALPESHTEFDSLLDALVAKLSPNSTVEHFLVKRIANCAWQLRRSDKLVSSQIHDQIPHLSDPNDPALLAVAKLYHQSRVFGRRLQYRINRSHSLFLDVKQSHFSETVQQFEQELHISKSGCETNPLVERVL